MISRWIATVGILLGAVISAGAETVTVGRASIDLPHGAWQLLSVSDGRTELNGGATGSVPMDNQAFVLTSGSEIQAILYISSSRTGAGVLTNWLNTCKATERSYALSLTSNPKSLECGTATAALKTDVYLRLAMPHVLKAVEDRRLGLPEIVQSTNATVGNSSGTSLHINLLAVPAFVGLQNSENLNPPSAVKVAHAAWARQLTLAVKESVYSVNGRMTIPAVTFAAHRGTSSTPQ